MKGKYMKIQTMGTDVALKVMPGHFATNHAHINYYLDMTTMKSRLSEAEEVARTLVTMYMYDMMVDTIVCMDGTQVLGACLAQELTKGGYLSQNAHKTIYVISPEYNSNSQIIFQESYLPMIQGKNVVILAAAVTTGLTVNKGIEAIQYYGGNLQGVSAIFSALGKVNDIPVKAVFKKDDLPDYNFSDYRDCPMCSRGEKLDALVNPYGYTAM